MELVTNFLGNWKVAFPPVFCLKVHCCDCCALGFLLFREFLKALENNIEAGKHLLLDLPTYLYCHFLNVLFLKVLGKHLFLLLECRE